MMNNEEICWNCKYWSDLEYHKDRTKPPENYYIGNCKRHSPIIELRITTNNFDKTGAWPMTSAMDFCGDWMAIK